MLQQIGLNSTEELFHSIPEDLRLRGHLNTPAALSEIELLAGFEGMAEQNTAARRSSFLGAGAYSHYIPTIVDHIISRSEFFTAYTPYQAEISQGTLQVIFEFQTLMCQLTGQEVANASMYDGSTALTEAALMAERLTGRHRMVVARSVHSEYREVLATYARNAGLQIGEIPFTESGQVDAAAARAAVNAETAALVVQSPNFFGVLEQVPQLAEIAHAREALLIVAITE